MSEVFTPLCDVDPMSERIKVKARCVSIWRSHAPGKPTPVWSLDCVIQDEQGNRIQCTIRKDDMPKYEGLLQEGRINEADTVDIIGTIVSLGDLIPFNNHERYKKKDGQDENEFKIALFSPTTYVLTPENFFKGATKKIVGAIRDSYKKKDGQDENEFKIALFSPTTYVLTPKNFFKGATKKIVGAIRDSYDEYTCVIYAKVHKIHKEYGWYYPACKKCSKRATLSDASASGSKASGSGGRRKFWKCDTHGKLNGVVYRYKIIVRVIDESGSASLVLFDNMVHKLLNDTPCWELMEKYHHAPEDVFPSEIDVIVGKKMLFKFTYTEFNITNNNHVYQVKMLSDDREMISVFKEGFLPVENEEDQELDKQAKDVAALSGPDSDNVDGSEFVTPETVKWAGKTSEGMFGYSDDMKALKDGNGGSAGDGSSGSGKRNIIDLDEINEEEYDAKRAKQPDGANQPEVQVKIEKE
ncbi:replication protein A 70 kDa DNA-binding subunit B [Artemisia annua]|uniref:Replication protein A 70 kDa DNA-binding subunit B n=1 Tax=Artemisia annua TaxID=35608 RepID=A0A2U1N1K6_ARTAN|nr:replication protein A 70 kDa DNA-binding subunit B [Artemisia annua]